MPMRHAVRASDVRMVKLPRIRRPRPTRWFNVHLLSSVGGRIILAFGLLVIILVAVVAISASLARQHQSTLAEMEQRTATASSFREARLSGEPLIPLLQWYLFLRVLIRFSMTPLMMRGMWRFGWPALSTWFRLM